MKAFSKYKKAFVMGFQSQLEYRVDFIQSLISGIFVVVIQCFIWKAVFTSSSDSVIDGYTFSQMIAYSILAGLVSKIVSADFQSEIARDIKSGGLSKFLVQPIHYFSYQLFCFLGKKVPQLIFLVLASTAALLGCGFFLNITFRPERLLIFAVFSLLAMLLNFLIYYCLSALAFVMGEVWGIFVGTGQMIMILGGGIFPIDIFGRHIASILRALPFQYLIFYPVNIATNKLPLDEIKTGVAVLAAWIFILCIVAHFCWKSGLKKYVAVGG